MENPKNFFIGILMTLPFFSALTATVAQVVIFNKECSGYLSRAAHANTIQLADQELSTALDYLNQHNLTHGYTSIFYNTPDEDIGFWYTNLVESKKELDTLRSKTDLTALEQSNTLIKLRETLMSHGEQGDSVRVPDGISRYPNNLAYFVWWVLGAVVGMLGAIIAAYEMERR